MIPDVMREIGGVTYTFRFSARTAIEIEQTFGCRITELPKKLGTEPTVEATAKIAKLCMRRDGKMLTDEEFEALLDNVTIEELADMVSTALEAGLVSRRAGRSGSGN